MKPGDIIEAPCAVPEGLAVVPLEGERGAGALRIGLIVRSPADPARGMLIVLRDTLDARVLLGCIIDRGQRIQEWIEIWIQNPPARGASASSGTLESQSNAGMDARWRLLIESMERAAPDSLIRTGWEASPMPASFLDTAKLSARAVMTPNRTWSLCRDEAALQAAALPSYTSTGHRYLVGLEDGQPPAFIATTPDAPPANGVRTIDQAVGAGPNLLPINPTAGMMLVRRHFSVKLESYLDALTSGRPEVAQSESSAAVSWADSGWMFLGSNGQAGRMIESLHLKVRTICQVIGAVMETVRASKRPLLSLDIDSFRIRSGMSGRGVPALWDAKAELVDPGLSMELQIPGSDVRYFLPRRVTEASIYRRTGAQGVSGRATVRARQTLSAAGGTTIIEGTIATQERLSPASQDLVWIRLPLPSKPVDLYARLEAEKALAPGEWRFRTVPTRLDEATTKEIRAAAGILFNDVSFEHLPLLNTPADLYAMGVLATRALLVNPQTTLPVALDELWSLARRAAQEANDGSVPLPQRIGQAMSKDPRLLEQLGPHRLRAEPMPTAEAMNLVPADVWWQVLAAIIRMFPGLSADSIYLDLGDAPSDGQHKVFEPAAADFEALLLRTRSMVLIDWNANREVHSVIRGLLTGLSGSTSARNDEQEMGEPPPPAATPAKKPARARVS